MSALSGPEFHSEEAAFARLEKIVWGDTMVCVRCGGVDRITKVKSICACRCEAVDNGNTLAHDSSCSSEAIGQAAAQSYEGCS